MLPLQRHKNIYYCILALGIVVSVFFLLKNQNLIDYQKQYHIFLEKGSLLTKEMAYKEGYRFIEDSFSYSYYEGRRYKDVSYVITEYSDSHNNLSPQYLTTLLTTLYLEENWSLISQEGTYNRLYTLFSRNGEKLFIFCKRIYKKDDAITYLCHQSLLL
jgi:hypothetical protein